MANTDEVDTVLWEIEKKYTSLFTHKSASGRSNDKQRDDQVNIIMEEFNSLGLPEMHGNSSESELLQHIMHNTFLLIHMYRKALLQISEASTSHRTKDADITELEKKMTCLKSNLKTMEYENLNLKRNLTTMTKECEKLSKIVSTHNKETDKIKHFFKSKESRLIRQIHILQNENHHLKEMCTKDIDKYFSKEDKLLKILKNYKHNEEVYKNALDKLEENNVQIMNEILNLKEELALSYSKKEHLPVCSK